MTELADWLREQMQARNYTQIQAAVHAGVSQGTISGILQKGHIPRLDALFRLADHFGASRVKILQIAGHLQRGDELPRGRPQPDHADYLIDELLAAFDKVPEAWRPEVISQLEIFVRLAERPPYRLVGDEALEEPHGG
jgi:transcriptional regulator with XRE-family HTH domain